MQSRVLLFRRALARAVDSALQALLASLVLGFFVEQNNGEKSLDAPAGVVALVIFGIFLYELLPLRATGATAGKALLRLRVVEAGGASPGWHTAVVRASLAPAIIAIAVSTPVTRGIMPVFVALLYATALGTRDGRGIVDWAAGTHVASATAG